MESLRRVWRKLVWIDKIFLALLLGYSVAALGGANRIVAATLLVAALLAGGAAAIRQIAIAIRKAIWRLSYRLYVTYIFIAFVPVILILLLAQLGASFLAQQVGVYLVNSELDRRISTIRGMANSLSHAPESVRPEAVRRTGTFFRERFPGLQILIRQRGREWHFPEEPKVEAPPEGWESASGILAKEGLLYSWAHAVRGDVQVLVLAPLSRAFLLNLVPELGSIDLVWFPDPDRNNALHQARPHNFPSREQASAQALPPPVNRFDREILWGTPVPVAIWSSPGTYENYLLSVHTRISAILREVFSQGGEWNDQGLLQLLWGVGMLFLMVELVSLVIGVSLTRTITGAVHALYEGTQRVREGDFSHRIEVKGNDQLADLAHSFNTMTENLQRLVTVEKERERLHAELEIAREVQDALHPRSMPTVKGLRVVAACNAARIVSGDYYDYQMIGDRRVGIAIGDVAGKGISAALLMATVQSSFRTQIRHSAEAAAATAGGGHAICSRVSTAALVTQLNQQLYDYTAAEKYATFYFAIYDDDTGCLHYTNAGHIPPILVRNGDIHRLEINGIVVGAFPSVKYAESCLNLEPGDLLVCFTDGVTEPENEYGEMFGEDRLIDVIARNAHRGEQEIIQAVVDSVREWTGSPELQDDLTMLLARKL